MATQQFQGGARSVADGATSMVSGFGNVLGLKKKTEPDVPPAVDA